MALNLDSRALQGASKMISYCLDLHPNDDLLIITDEKTLEVALLINKASREWKVPSSILLVPIEEQIAFNTPNDIPSSILTALKSVPAILTCVVDDPAAMRFRKSIIKEALSSSTKVGHCPGINKKILASALNINYELLTNQCNLLARIMVRCKHAEITTLDKWQKPHILSLGLGQWERVPIASTGVIEQGLWGNIPSGETYLAPLEEKTDGEIVINGSIPGYAFGTEEEIILTFSEGILKSIKPDNNSRGAEILRSLLAAASQGGDLWCKKIGELGIGLNTKVGRFTGKPLIDEKKARTAHIALGNNTQFGGQNTSNIHLDLVTFKPSITLDGISIMHQGTLVASEEHWLADYESYAIPDNLLQKGFYAIRAGNEIDDNRRSGLRRRLISSAGPGKYVSVDVGNARTSRLTAYIYDKIPPIDKVAIAELVADTRIEKHAVLALLSLMRDYQLIDILEEAGGRINLSHG